MRKESVKGSVDLLHGPILKNLLSFTVRHNETISFSA